MENKINIAEILRNCPQGMELYSPLCGKCVFDRLNMGTIICKKQNTQEIIFTSEGYYMLPVFDDCECVLFPSKDQRDWSKFQRPFKDGDVVVNQMGKPFILKSFDLLSDIVSSYCGISCWGSFELDNVDWTSTLGVRLATDKEKQELFDAIKAKGYRWNAETKTLEELIQPKFKVGDRIVHKVNKESPFIITEITNDCYKGGTQYEVLIEQQNNFELVPYKFDINTLKPFDKVLTRANDDDSWVSNLYSHRIKDYYVVLNAELALQCIPYEGNEHLLGKTDNCSDFYKTWE